jgi:hypothetical protein
MKRNSMIACVVGLVLVGHACAASDETSTEGVTFNDSGDFTSPLHGDVALVDATSLERIGEVSFGDTPHVTYRATVSRAWYGEIEALPGESIEVFEVLNYENSVLGRAAERSTPVLLLVNINEKDTPQAEATGTHLSLQGAFVVDGTVASPSIVSFFGPGLGDAWEDMIRSAGPALLALDEDAPAEQAIAAVVRAANDGRETELDTVFESEPTDPVPGDGPADAILRGSDEHVPLLVNVLGDRAADAPASIVRATTSSGVVLQGVIGDGNPYASLTVPLKSGESVDIEIFSGDGLLDEFGSDEFETRVASFTQTYKPSSDDLDEIGTIALIIRPAWGPTGIADETAAGIEEVPIGEALDLLVTIDADAESGPSGQDVGP